MAMTAAKRRGPTSTNGGSTDGIGAFNEINDEITNLWTVSHNWLTNIGGTVDAITADTDHIIADAITAYKRPMTFYLTPVGPNTTAVQINIDAVGLVNLFDKHGDPLQGGELAGGGTYPIVFDGSNFRGSDLEAGSAATVSTAPDMIIEDQKSSGTSGGSFLTGAWRQRDLNTSVRNVLVGSSLALNAVTLPAGTYYIEWSCPAYAVLQNQTRLFNATDSSVVAYGDTVNPSGGGVSLTSSGATMFQCTSTKTIRLEHRSAGTELTNGFGIAASFGNVEVYSRIKIWKQ